MDFKVAENTFKLSGRDFFVYSGEVHYFRLRPESWPLHLKKATQANLNTISTYIPWDWHEYEEGKFDFTGQTNPQRNLIGFIELCKKNGLFLIVKPGPYILAEYKDHGIPEWLLSSHPELLSIKADGKPFGHARLTLMHQVFLKYVKNWYAAVFDIIGENQITKTNGIIISVQLCNEVGVFPWLDKEADYSDVALEYYRKFLSDKYKKVSRLNAIYKTKYKSFASIIPPSGVSSRLSALAWDLDWHLFWRRYYAIYLEYLMKEALKRGVEVPLTHNLPGWVGGRALEYPMNITMYEDVAKFFPKIILTVDHIPENVSYRNFHDAALVQQMTKAVYGKDAPLFVAEMQAGTREHTVVTYPDELELFYKASLAYGACGMNFYMFSQGKNPKSKSSAAPTFYWQTPLDYDGKEGPLYPIVRRLGKFISSFGNLLVNARVDSKVALLFYKPYYHTELTGHYDVEKMGLKYNPKYVRDNIFFEGIAKVLKMLNCDYDVLDLQLCRDKELSEYKQVWIVSLEYMDAGSQKLLSQYVLNGGHLVMLPCVARYDLSFNPCEILKQTFKLGEQKLVRPRTPKIEFLDVSEIPVVNPIQIFNEPGAQPVAFLEDGSICGIIKRLGGGTALLLGTAFGYIIEEHLEAYSRILKLDDIQGQATSTNNRLIVQELFGSGYAFLFIANYYRTQESGYITYTHPVSKGEVKMPQGLKLTLPPLSGLLIPVNVPISGGAGRILFATSQILSAFEKGGSIYMELLGSPKSVGEVVLALKARPKQVFVDGKKAECEFSAGEARLSFRHSDEGPVLLKI